MECLLTNMFKDVLGWVENNQAVQEWKRFASIFVHLVVGFHACKGRGMLWLSWWATRIRRILWLWYPRGKIWKSNICNVWLLHILSCYFHIFHQVAQRNWESMFPWQHWDHRLRVLQTRGEEQPNLAQENCLIMKPSEASPWHSKHARGAKKWPLQGHHVPALPSSLAGTKTGDEFLGGDGQMESLDVSIGFHSLPRIFIWLVVWNIFYFYIYWE